jgi:hypothetical protein
MVTAGAYYAHAEPRASAGFASPLAALNGGGNSGVSVSFARKESAIAQGFPIGGSNSASFSARSGVVQGDLAEPPVAVLEWLLY